MKKILIIGATHGNEKIGLEINEELSKKGLDQYFDFLIGNPKAEKMNQRFFEKDLNRSYPGKRNSKYLEERRAYKILKIAKKYKYVIDFHEASKSSRDFIIVSKNELPKKFPLNFIELRDVLLWPNPKGPLGSLLENEIELEFGMDDKNRKSVIKKATKIIEKFMKAVYLDENLSEKAKKIYYVYDKFEIKNIQKEFDFKEFQLVKINNEEFYPLLVDQYLNLGIKCYKMKKIK